MEEIKRRVRSTIAEALRLENPPGDLGDEDDLSERLGVDSVGFLEILMSLEEEFGVSLTEASATRQSAGSVQKLADLVSRSPSER